MKHLFILLFNAMLLTNSALGQKSDPPFAELLQRGSLQMVSEASVAVPLWYQKGSLPFVTVLINGKEYSFLFDTGASICMLSEELAAAFETKGSSVVEDASGVNAEHKVVLAKLALGSAVFSDILCVVGDAKRLEALGCIKIDGILGSNAINLCNWKIDPQQQSLSFSKSPFEKAADEVAVPVFFTNNRLPIIKTNLSTAEFYALFDFGFYGHLELNQSNMGRQKAMNTLPTLKGSGRFALSANSTEKGNISQVLLDSVFFGELVGLQIPTLLTKRMPTIGASFLKGYVVTYNTGGKLNSSGGMLYLSHLKVVEPSALAFPVRLGINSAGDLMVDFVWQTPATKGIKVGQKVLSVQGTTYANVGFSDLCEINEALTAATTLKIVVEKKGKPYELELSREVR